MSIENLLNKKAEELDSRKLHEKATQEHQEARKIRKMKPLVEAANELKQLYVTDPSYQWEVSDRMVHLWSILSVYDEKVTLRLPLFSFPNTGFQYKFEASRIEYFFDPKEDSFVIDLTGSGRSWELRKDSCDELLDHFIEQIAQIRVNQDPSGEFWKYGKCPHFAHHGGQNSKLYYAAEGASVDVKLDKYMVRWGPRVSWLCDPCLITRKGYVKITAIADNLGGTIRETLAVKDVQHGNL